MLLIGFTSNFLFASFYPLLQAVISLQILVLLLLLSLLVHLLLISFLYIFTVRCKYKLSVILALLHFLTLETGYVGLSFVRCCSIHKHINYWVNLSANDLCRLKHCNLYSEFIRRDYHNRNSITITVMKNKFRDFFFKK
jgi:hypothetical protein